MTHERFTPADLRTRAAHLRLWALGVLVWLMELIGAHSRIGASMARSVRADLLHAEQIALAIAVLLADKPALAPQRRGAIPCADARRARRTSALRAVTRGLLPALRSRDLRARIARLDAFLDDLDSAARIVARRLARGLGCRAFAAGERASDRADTVSIGSVHLTMHDTS
jgi:hypothetical protein